MAAISGDLGSITIAADNNLDALLNAWTCNFEQEVMTASAFGQWHKQRATGTYQWGGTFSGFIDDVGALMAAGVTAFSAGTSTYFNGTITLVYRNVTTDGQFGGACGISNLSWGTSRDGFATVSGSFIGTEKIVPVLPIT